MDDEYAKLIRRMNPPRVTIDNNSCKDATVIQCQKCLLRCPKVSGGKIIIEESLRKSVKDVYEGCQRVRCLQVLDTLHADLERHGWKETDVYLPSCLAFNLCVMLLEDKLGALQVESVNKHGILLEVVQVLTDLNLVITKAYISSDGGWFMDVFNVVDRDGKKVRDGVIGFIKKTLENDAFAGSLRRSVGLKPSENHTSIELAGTDRPGLLSEVCAVLADLQCNVVNAEIWTHNARAAAVVHVTDDKTGCAIEDPKRLSIIKKLLCNVLRGNDDLRTAKMTVSPPGRTHRQRRLHQIMFAERDYEKVERIEEGEVEERLRPHVTVLDCVEKDYTVISMRSKDRPKLLFDTVCTLTDMQYVVFHGVVHTGRNEAYQEYYIRHVDGLPISSEAERERVMQCLEAAIERRTSEALMLELCTEDRIGLLSDITRIFRENSLCIKQAEIITEGLKVKDTFYVTDVTGHPVDPKTIDSIRRQIGQTILQVRWNSSFPAKAAPPPGEATMSFLFGNLFKSIRFQTFKLIKSYS